MRYERRVRYRCQLGKRHHLSLLSEPAGDVDRQASLADPAGVGQGQQAYVVTQQQAGDLRHLPLATDQRGRLHRQVVRSGIKRAEGWELVRKAIDNELEDTLRTLNVLEVVLA